MYINLSRLEKEDYVHPKYFNKFYSYTSYLSEYGSYFEDEMEIFLEEVLNELYNDEKINFLYYLNDIKVTARDYFQGYIKNYRPRHSFENMTYIFSLINETREYPTFQLSLSKKKRL